MARPTLCHLIRHRVRRGTAAAIPVGMHRSFVAALALVSLAACSSPSTGEGEKVVYDGKTLVRGIYFAEGPAASVVESWHVQHSSASANARAPSTESTAEGLRRAAARLRTDKMPNAAASLEAMAKDIQDSAPTTKVRASKEEQREVVEAILDSIGKKDPTFYLRFAHDVQSGNQVRVDKAVREGGFRIVGALASLRPAPTTAGSRTLSLQPASTGGGSGGGSSGGGSSGGGDGSSGDGDQSGADSSSGDDGAKIQEAKVSFQMNVQVWYETVGAVQNVAVYNNTLFWSKSDDGIQTAAFVDHLTQGFAR